MSLPTADSTSCITCVFAAFKIKYSTFKYNNANKILL